MNKCYQCKKENKRTGTYFCSEKCRQAYWPNNKQESFGVKLKRLNDMRGIGRKKLYLHKLKCGFKAWIDFDSEEKCNKCGALIRWATTDKNKKPMPVELVDGEWDTHFATCDKSIEKSKQLVKDAEEVFL